MACKIIDKGGVIYKITLNNHGPREVWKGIRFNKFSREGLVIMEFNFKEFKEIIEFIEEEEKNE
ncbi:MAG: hypothetical protein ACFFDN_47695 [Candidatus Hodarchaeota archaeon]